MSPRRKLAVDEPDFFDVVPKPPRRWGLPTIAVLATLLIAAGITATVRVDFDKSPDGKWRVANLIVLKKPQMNQAGQ